MSEMEMHDDVETKEFTDELSDEALDRTQTKICMLGSSIGCSRGAPEINP
jgi:hypothetical protein